MSILHTDVEVDPKTHEFRIKHTWDEYACLKACYEERMSGNQGWLHNGKAKKLAMIPRELFSTDIELKRYMQLRGVDNVEAKKIMDRWLMKHPEYRTSSIGGRKEV
jgi:hypothetical protein